jgi:hypothetical protein
MKGNWGEVSESFNERKKKPANDGAVEAVDEEADMFLQAGAAAE